jgi:hypothetical protein
MSGRWSLVTAPDERERCCFVPPGGDRCEQRSAWRIEGRAYAWDDYTFVCGDHVAVVLAASGEAVLLPIVT